MIRTAKTHERSTNTPLWPANYRTGMWAWTLHRISGVALAAYLVTHIIVISSSARGPGGINFNSLLATLTQPFFLALDLLLWAAVLYHTLNGIRILLFDAGVGVRRQKMVFWGFMTVAILAWIGGLIAILPFIMGRPPIS
ncbi:MAG: succinate dehydrogenase, cytochrome b556 subunit [Dehalococcoidia bacterium]|nr:succinate dehydrogenase, cytochrome b556 subunit [Dehalococcoidia bacterium]